MKGFEIVRSIGRGATSEVFEARDAQGRTVALKVFPPGFRALQWHAWKEAELLSKLEHPAILRVYGFGQEETRPYIVMELIQGPSLERRVLDQGPLYQSDAVRMVRRIAEGLGRAHAAGIAHGDLKPRNILLRGGDPLQPVICDFGLTARASKEGDVAALGDLLRFTAGDHPLVSRLRRPSAEAAIEQIDEFLTRESPLPAAPTRRGCLGLFLF